MVVSVFLTIGYVGSGVISTRLRVFVKNTFRHFSVSLHRLIPSETLSISLFFPVVVLWWGFWGFWTNFPLGCLLLRSFFGIIIRPSRIHLSTTSVDSSLQLLPWILLPSTSPWSFIRHVEGFGSRLGDRHGSVCVDGELLPVCSCMKSEHGVIIFHFWRRYSVRHTFFGLILWVSLDLFNSAKQWWIVGVVRSFAELPSFCHTSWSSRWSLIPWDSRLLYPISLRLRLIGWLIKCPLDR